jgi:hypothetical protein
MRSSEGEKVALVLRDALWLFSAPDFGRGEFHPVGDLSLPASAI